MHLPLLGRSQVRKTYLWDSRECRLCKKGNFLWNPFSVPGHELCPSWSPTITVKIPFSVQKITFFKIWRIWIFKKSSTFLCQMNPNQQVGFLGWWKCHPWFKICRHIDNVRKISFLKLILSCSAFVTLWLV